MMKISKIFAGMSAAAIVASMAMIPASAAGTIPPCLPEKYRRTGPWRNAERGKDPPSSIFSFWDCAFRESCFSTPCFSSMPRRP